MATVEWVWTFVSRVGCVVLSLILGGYGLMTASAATVEPVSVRPGVEQTPSDRRAAVKELSRDHERHSPPFDRGSDPLVGAVEFARAVATYEPPAPEPPPSPSPSAPAPSSSPAPQPTAVVAPESDGLNWAALAACESGGDPRAVNPAGYYGLYQFSLSTWASVGGSGNPVDASPAEQTARAQILYSRSGDAPWPVCGSQLYS